VRGCRVAAALALLLAGCAGPSSPPPPADPDLWFVEVEQEGGYWLGPEDLLSIGMDPQGEAAPSPRLSWNGQEIPTLPLRTAAGWGLFFFGPDRSTRYTRQTAFRLETDADGESMLARPLPPAAEPSPGGLVVARWEQDIRYLPQADAETPWFWESLIAPAAVTHTVTLTDALPGPVTATVHLWSHTALPADPDHHLRLWWDGELAGEWQWDGLGLQHLTASWWEDEAAADHTLVLETPALPGADIGMMWTDGWDLTYRRQVDASGAVWQAEGTARAVARVEAGARLVDVTDPLAPVDYGLVPEDGRMATTPGHHYWVGIPQQAPRPLAVRPAAQVDLDSLEGVAYLALAPPELQPPLQTLLDLRRSEGLSAAVVDPWAVYDTFGSGRPDPDAVVALVRSLPDLRYLLLVGDGTAEPRGYDGPAGALRTVAPLTRTAILGETPADALFGLDDDGRPAVAVGRFPATSVEQVAAMVDKTVRWETGTGMPSSVLLVDDERQFLQMAEQIAPLLAAITGDPPLWLDASDEASRAELLETLGRDPVWLTYTGHGGLALLGDEGLLTLEDSEARGEPALIVAWTCLAGHFIHPAQDSLGESWLRSSRGGAVAFLGPTGESTTGEQKPYVLGFYRAALEQPRLGDAWVAAMQESGSRDVRWGFVLLGDPALHLSTAR